MPGCGAIPAASSSSLSAPRNRRSSVIASRPVRLDREHRLLGLRPAMSRRTCRAAPAWMTITLTAWATTSWSSRATCRRSSAAAASRRALAFADRAVRWLRPGDARRPAGLRTRSPSSQVGTRTTNGRTRPSNPSAPWARNPPARSVGQADDDQPGTHPIGASLAGGEAGQADRTDLDPRRRRRRAGQERPGRHHDEDRDRPHPAGGQGNHDKRDRRLEPAAIRSIHRQQAEKRQRDHRPEGIQPLEPGSGRRLLVLERAIDHVGHRVNSSHRGRDVHPTRERARLIRMGESTSTHPSGRCAFRSGGR